MLDPHPYRNQLNPLTPTVAIWIQLGQTAMPFKPPFVICERQSARISKIANDGLTLSVTGCFVAVPTWLQWASRG